MVGAFLLCRPDANAQISEGGTPPSFEQEMTLRKTVTVTEVPVDLYIEDLLEVDNWRSREGGLVPVAKIVPVSYNMDNSGYFTALASGEEIWRLHLRVADAKAVLLCYSDFYIPQGGKLFIYKPDRSQVLGAYTNSTNPSGGLFATEFVGGDELILEYVKPATATEMPRINISDIGYGYNAAALKEFAGVQTRGVAGSCEVNINCEEGDAWQNEKKSVCYMTQKIGSHYWLCTGSLLNNTAADFKPLVLSAYHCSTDETYITEATEDEMKQWVFYFHKELDGCSNSSSNVVPKTIIGCTKLVGTNVQGQSDGLLLLLNSAIPDYYDVYYNGWDRRDIPANSGVGIHHPQGDFKKISTYVKPAYTANFYTAEVQSAKNAHWNVTFSQTPNGFGVTEGGSSGSPLYNENKLVVGSLSGGSSECVIPTGLNLYGKLSYHWNKFTADSSTRMDVWLDPLNLGVETLPGSYSYEVKPAPRNLVVTRKGQSVYLEWSAPASEESPVLYKIFRNNIKIDEVDNLTYLDLDPVAGSLVYSVSAVYADNMESAVASATILYVKYKAPSDLTAERISEGSNYINITWKEPVYEQIVYWGDLNPNTMIGFFTPEKERVKFYYGQQWSTEDLIPLNKRTITNVQFVPIYGNLYEIVIMQGDNGLRQEVVFSQKNAGRLYDVKLETPYIIDASKSLIVSVYTKTLGTDHPAICDDGPVVGGRGDLVSEDGVEWGKLSDEGPNFDYNFVVSMTVSSEIGQISTDAQNAASSTVVSGKTANRNPSIRLSNSEVKPLSAAVSDANAGNNKVAPRSSIALAFPEITNYKLYRGGQTYKTLDPDKTMYMENSSLTYYYEISALYGSSESVRSEKANVGVVNTEYIDYSVDISPTGFSSQVYLKGKERVSRIDVVSVSGKVCLVVNNPDEIIDTSSLSQGLYFFRIYCIDNTVKVVKAIKTK
jgi:hypothetical protein